MSRLHVHDRSKHGPNSIEARLGTIGMTEPPAHLRQRVLAAVDAVLAEPPAEIASDESQWSLLAAAAAAVLLVASWGGSLGISRSYGDPTMPHSVSLIERMAAAGIQFDSRTQPLKEPVEPL